MKDRVTQKGLYCTLFDITLAELRRLTADQLIYIPVASYVQLQAYVLPGVT